MKTELKQRYIPYLFSIAGSILIVAKLILGLAYHSHLCAAHGCVVAESIVRVPYALDLLGLLFFQAVSWMLLTKRYSLFPLLLEGALVAEGILLGVQAEILDYFCLYCLAIAALVLLISAVVLDRRQFLAGLSLFCIPILLFFVLSLPTVTQDLSSETYGVRLAVTRVPKFRWTLIYSHACFHCNAVLTQIQDCTNAKIRFNPVNSTAGKNLPPNTVIAKRNYDPRVNRQFLTDLGIHTIPVLVVDRSGEREIFCGDTNILRYLRSTRLFQSHAGLKSRIEALFKSDLGGQVPAKASPDTASKESRFRGAETLSWPFVQKAKISTY